LVHYFLPTHRPVLTCDYISVWCTRQCLHNDVIGKILWSTLNTRSLQSHLCPKQEDKFLHGSGCASCMVVSFQGHKLVNSSEVKCYLYLTWYLGTSKTDLTDEAIKASSQIENSDTFWFWVWNSKATTSEAEQGVTAGRVRQKCPLSGPQSSQLLSLCISRKST
jgi:hypothetical protein